VLAQENGLQIPSDKWHVLCEQGDADGDKNFIGTAYTTAAVCVCVCVCEIKYWVRHTAHKGQEKSLQSFVRKSEEKRLED
jgi:hypothetical protein